MQPKSDVRHQNDPQKGTSAMRGTVDGRCALTSDSSTCQIDKFASGTFGSGINKWLLIVDVEIFAQAVRTRRDYECCVRVP